jgi:hypothetical protein
MYLGSLGIEGFADAIVPEGYVARVPTATGHLVFPAGGIEGVTYNTDKGAGPKRLAQIQAARADRKFVVELDRAIETEVA